MPRFDFATATRIIFAPGALGEIGPLAQQYGSRALVVTGRDPGRAEPLLAALRRHGVQTVAFAVTGEPEIQTVEGGVALARQEGCQLVISLGGGSAIDAGKAVAAMLANEGELLDYLEVVGRGKALSRPSVPFIAIPTTAGTGSEVTTCLQAAAELKNAGIAARVVSMPSFRIYDEQPDSFRRELLPESVPKISVEAGATMGWWKYVGTNGAVIGIDRFGASAPGPIAMEKLGISVANVVEHAKRLVKK